MSGQAAKGATVRGRCPQCQRAFDWDPASPWRPFCSERCRLIDLGDWLSEGHRIAGDPAPGPVDDPHGGH